MISKVWQATRTKEKASGARAEASKQGARPLPSTNQEQIHGSWINWLWGLMFSVNDGRFDSRATIHPTSLDGPTPWRRVSPKTLIHYFELESEPSIQD